jgi:hypothetical protein
LSWLKISETNIETNTSVEFDGQEIEGATISGAVFFLQECASHAYETFANEKGEDNPSLLSLSSHEKVVVLGGHFRVLTGFDTHRIQHEPRRSWDGFPPFSSFSSNLLLARPPRLHCIIKHDLLQVYILYFAPFK